MKPPKVSVIIPVYNVEAYLPKCLDSVINQTLKEIEIIVVNDGSKDKSLDIPLEYKAKDNRLKVIDKENGGLGEARNFGINQSTGEYISFVDSDDYISVNMLLEMHSKAINTDSDIVFCALNKVDERDEIIKTLRQSNFPEENISLNEDFSFFGDFSCFACNKLFKSSLFKEKRFKTMHFEDIDLIPKIVLESKKIAIINKPFYNYLERQGSISKNHTIQGLDLLKAVNSVSSNFNQSFYKNQQKELKRFQILQGFYSFLAYVAFVKDRETKNCV